MKQEEKRNPENPEKDYLQIALDEASSYLMEYYDSKGIKYRKYTSEKK